MEREDPLERIERKEKRYLRILMYKYRITIVSLFVLFGSCSTMKENLQEPLSESDVVNWVVTTKTGINPPNVLLKDELDHVFQVNRVGMLINGIVFNDSTYVQTLTEEDMESLSVKEEEKKFSVMYVKALNDNMKKHKQ